MHLLIGLFHIGLVVGETTSHHTTRNQVERLRPGPILLEIVELKGTVWRDAIVAGLVFFYVGM